MAQENLELVERAYAAINREDWDDAFSDAHPDFAVTFQRGFNAGTYRGREDVQRAIADAREAFDSWVTELSELHDAGDRVVAIVIQHVRPHGTDGELELRNGHLWTIRDGVAISMVGYPSPEDALAAAGLAISD